MNSRPQTKLEASASWKPMISALIVAAVFFALVVMLSACGLADDDLSQSTATGILIQNATIVDGTGTRAYRSSIRVGGERITALDDGLVPQPGEAVIDAKGLVVAPGFIDLHAHVSNIHEYPQAENFLRQGVTTIANSLHSHDLPWPLDDYTSGLSMAPNIAYFAGFNWTRKTVMGLDNRPPTEVELMQMKSLVRQAMQQGAFGLSSGMEYVPAVYASNEEVTELAKVVAEWAGIYVTHMRDEGSSLLESIRDSAQIGKAASLPVHINHIKTTGVDNHGKSVDALELISNIRASGVDMTTDIYPYTAFMTYSDLLFPAWSLAGGAKGFRARINDPVQRETVAAEMKAIFPQLAGEGFDSIQFGGLPDISGYAGRTLGDYLREHHLPETLDAAVETLIQLQLKGRFVAIYHSMSEADVETFLLYPHTMISSDGDLAVTREKQYHPRSYGAFPRVLASYVRARGLISLEQAIHKMTGQPAERLGLRERGVIKVGNFADLVIFDNEEISDHATYLQPHQFSEGIEHLLVNGQCVLHHGHVTSALPGKVLKHRPRENASEALPINPPEVVVNPWIDQEVALR